MNNVSILQTDAKRNRTFAQTRTERLEGLEPIMQEFHKRGILLQVLKSYSRKYYHVGIEGKGWDVTSG